MKVHVMSNTPVRYPGEIPAQLKSYLIPGMTARVMTGQFGKFLFQTLTIAGTELSIRLNLYLIEKTESFVFSNDKPHLHLQTGLKNSFYYYIDGIGERPFRQHSFNILYLPYHYTRITFQPGEYQTLKIGLPIAFLKRLEYQNTSLQSFIDKASGNLPALLYPFDPHTTAPMKQLITDLLQITGKAIDPALSLENKVGDLLIAALSSVSENQFEKMQFKNTDMDRLYQAREILLDNLQQTFSLAHLVRKTGLNAKKLKIGFRDIFGVPPYQLLQNARMEKGRQLLGSTDISITGIAEMVGYSSLQSFSKAFLRHFGMRPQEYRNQRRE